MIETNQEIKLTKKTTHPDLVKGYIKEGASEQTARNLVARDLTIDRVRRDAENNRQKAEENQKFSLIDPLTGLFNRRHLGYQAENPSGVGELQREFDEAVRGKRDLSSLFLDIDHFKEYNDTYGHSEGDLVLKTIAETIKDSIRDIDVPVRYGGEEFFILLPQTDIDGATKLAERLRENIARITGLKQLITVSVGVASYHNSPDNRDRVFNTKIEQRDDLVEKADIAMYSSKQNGRNRVTVANDMTQKDVSKMRKHRERLHPYLKQRPPAEIQTNPQE